jgi:hypothetical protein
VYYRRNIDGGQSHCSEKRVLLHTEETLWTLGSLYPAADSHTLHLPFELQLPNTLLPSFSGKFIDRMGTIAYSVEVIGHRPGVFTRKQRIGRLFAVMSSATVSEIETRRLLNAGWQGPWRHFSFGENVRRSLWGSNSRIDVEVCAFSVCLCA